MPATRGGTRLSGSFLSASPDELQEPDGDREVAAREAASIMLRRKKQKYTSDLLERARQARFKTFNSDRPLQTNARSVSPDHKYLNNIKQFVKRNSKYNEYF